MKRPVEVYWEHVWPKLSQYEALNDKRAGGWYVSQEELVRAWEEYMKVERVAWDEYQDNLNKKMAEQTYTLDEFQDGMQGKNAEKLPPIFEVSRQQLEDLKYEVFVKDYNDGKGPKNRFVLLIGDKRFFAPQVVLSLLKKAKANQKLVRVVIETSGQGIGTRYLVKEVEGI
jgi:hypothetical protein